MMDPNPFGLSGGQAVIATITVCLTVLGVTGLSAWATVRVAECICEAVEQFGVDVAHILTGTNAAPPAPPAPPTAKDDKPA